MGRYLIDTNIMAFLITDKANLNENVQDIIDDYTNQIYVSSVTAMELVQLFRIGKIRPKYKTAEAMIKAIVNDFYFTILPFGAEQAKTLSKLEIVSGHNDPFDHSIISHAISDKLILISSDKKFECYTPQKLKFIYNKR
ncbi:type II toxin-antitoxin system VapC family toxin [Capnocytophaga sp.]|uniref:type II toxin-antitoxin system VapC family toxin n=1 Tax=Capnocytophaga sp. TaxID=44737 RepID=UPI0026DC75C9|nr:type II toxin-antitoxin system VapC family toxin [Capnocytophaga sp.]MDO5105041.1 type II toxin-antitoxin system VapC family toxin [Capnocytophaga sp.]